VTESKLVLLSESTRQLVGLGKVCSDQAMIHGHVVPHGFVKVIIDYIKPGTKPPHPMAFDEDELYSGQFAVWPKHWTKNAMHT